MVENNNTTQGGEHLYKGKFDGYNLCSDPGWRCLSWEDVHAEPILEGVATKEPSPDYWCGICDQERDPRQWLHSQGTNLGHR